MAPGQGVTSARSGTTTSYTTKSGTSQAAGFVSGVALLMFDADPSLTAGQVKGRLKSRALDWGIGGKSTDLASRGQGPLDPSPTVRLSLQDEALDDRAAAIIQRLEPHEAPAREPVPRAVPRRRLTNRFPLRKRLSCNRGARI
jgi:hypothetical protein